MFCSVKITPINKMENPPPRYPIDVYLLKPGTGEAVRLKRQGSRVERFQSCTVISDNVAEKIYNALAGDEDILRVCNVENGFRHRSHMPKSEDLEHIAGDITFNVPTKHTLNGVGRIYFILSYKESSQPCEKDEIISTEYILRVEPSTWNWDFHKSKHNFKDRIDEKDLPTIAVQEAKRILKVFGFFDVKMEDIELMRSMEHGRRTYAELAIIPNLEKYSKGEIIYSFEGMDEYVDYFIQNKSLHRRQTPKMDLETETVRNVDSDFYTEGFRKGIRCIWVGYHTHNLEEHFGKLVESVEDYLVAMENSVISLKKERAKTAGNGKSPRDAEFYDSWITNLVHHLKGFGTAALDFGDKLAAQRVNDLIREATVEYPVTKCLENP